MRDQELEQLFDRIGSEAHPNAEFEEDLLLRLEARLSDADVDAGDTSASARRSPAYAPVIELDMIADRKRRGRRPGRGLAAAAAAVVLIGIAGLTIAVRDPADDGPVATTPPTALDSGVAALCARHLDELVRIDDLGAPLPTSALAPEDDVREQLLNELVAVVDDYRTVLDADGSIEPAILAELDAIADVLANELVFVSRGRLDGARDSIPAVVDRLLAINSRLAELGEPCR